MAAELDPSMPEQRYIPAAGRSWLTPLFDPALALTTRERRWRAGLLDEVASRPASTVLDVGCGTGTLAIQVAKRLPDARIIGIDGDPEVLARAAAKTRSASVKVELMEAHAEAIPLGADSIDCALISLVLHHLDGDTERRALSEIRRVLAPGGQLLICDYGRPHDPLMRAAFLSIQLLDGFSTTRSHAKGQLPAFIHDAGFTACRIDRLRTVTGTIELWRAMSSS